MITEKRLDFHGKALLDFTNFKGRITEEQTGTKQTELEGRIVSISKQRNALRLARFADT